MIKLTSETFDECVCSRAAAMMSGLVAEILADSLVPGDSLVNCPGPVGPLPFSTATIVAGIQFCTRFTSESSGTSESAGPGRFTSESPGTSESAGPEGPDWCVDFVKTATAAGNPLELLRFADFMDIGPLLDACCRAEAWRISTNSPRSLRRIYGVEDFPTAEEKALFGSLRSWT